MSSQYFYKLSLLVDSFCKFLISVYWLSAVNSSATSCNLNSLNSAEETGDLERVSAVACQAHACSHIYITSNGNREFWVVNSQASCCLVMGLVVCDLSPPLPSSPTHNLKISRMPMLWLTLFFNLTFSFCYCSRRKCSWLPNYVCSAFAITQLPI